MKYVCFILEYLYRVKVYGHDRSRFAVAALLDGRHEIRKTQDTR